jgi:hypothetical protein
VTAKCQVRSLTDVKPLRRIVGQDGHFDVLECGHRLLIPKDAFGRERPAFYKRRCRKCAALLAEV